MRQWTLQSVSVIDEVIAREALSPRCRGPLLAKTLDAAATNLKLLQQLVQESKGRVECRIPAGGGTAFVKFLGEDGKAVDDVAFLPCAERSGGDFARAGESGRLGARRRGILGGL